MDINNPTYISILLQLENEKVKQRLQQLKNEQQTIEYEIERCKETLSLILEGRIKNQCLLDYDAEELERWRMHFKIKK